MATDEQAFLNTDLERKALEANWGILKHALASCTVSAEGKPKLPLFPTLIKCHLRGLDCLLTIGSSSCPVLRWMFMALFNCFLHDYLNPLARQITSPCWRWGFPSSRSDIHLLLTHSWAALAPNSPVSLFINGACCSP